MDREQNTDHNVNGIYEIEINRVPIKWDITKGSLSFFGIDSALFWTDPSISNMLVPIIDEIGKDLFRLLVAHSSSLGTEQDYHSMISRFSNNFAEGFLAWGKAVASAGWGAFELADYNPIEKHALVIVRNSWEMSAQRNIEPHKRWGTPFIQGKLIGIFSHAFGVSCWANDISHYNLDDSYTEIRIFQSNITIPDELSKLRHSRMLAREKQLSEMVDLRTSELQNAKLELASYAVRLEKTVSERTAELNRTNIKLKQEIEIRKNAEQKLEEMNKELLKMSITDKLTGISNRRHFDNILQVEWSRALRTGSSLTLIIGDVDWFKMYNDTYGHQAGDQCLKLVARILEENAKRASDLVARYGGEEFGVILPVTTQEQAIYIVENMIQSFRNLNLPHQKSYFGYVTMSFGLAITIPQSSKMIEDFLHEADDALYLAKANGRNQYMISAAQKDT